MTTRLCPECRQGKHRNCTREAWDDLTDGPTACLCECLDGPHMEHVDHQLHQRPATGSRPDRSFQESSQEDYYDGADQT